jgi:hypothetical protein
MKRNVIDSDEVVKRFYKIAGFNNETQHSHLPIALLKT